jgi:hypothetical protein
MKENRMRIFLVSLLCLGWLSSVYAHDKPAPPPPAAPLVVTSNDDNHNNNADNLKHAAEIAVTTWLFACVVFDKCHANDATTAIRFEGKQRVPE